MGSPLLFLRQALGFAAALAGAAGGLLRYDRGMRGGAMLVNG